VQPFNMKTEGEVADQGEQHPRRGAGSQQLDVDIFERFWRQLDSDQFPSEQDTADKGVVLVGLLVGLGEVRHLRLRRGCGVGHAAVEYIERAQLSGQGRCNRFKPELSRVKPLPRQSRTPRGQDDH
jgi:hypothetical protein